METKDLGKSLDEAEDSGQLQRYKKSLPNLILTDYLEFRWFVDGQLRDSARLGRIGTGARPGPPAALRLWPKPSAENVE
ncbi:MAG: hypothetical protein M0Q43_08510 [Methanothrix sp.]|nr:hypothetical protein [Methanothrix sp.]